MNNIKTIIKYELKRYFLSPLAYVYLVSFLLLSGSCAIYFGHFFTSGVANLWGLFDYQPWIYLLFIPGISMRSWAEEFRSKSIVQILTIPVSITDWVWGKFLAAWLFAVIAISLTFPFWITVNLLGNPDNTVIFISYLGCFVIAGAMLAISQTMSALTKNPIIAMVLAVFVNLLFFWSSFEYVLFWAKGIFNDVIVDTIISFSFLVHFASLSRGLVELRDIVFFGSLILFFNLVTIAVISLKTKGTSNLVASSSLKRGVLVLSLLFIGFFGLNIIANNVLRGISYDFTEEKYLSLTKNTKDILRNIKHPITAKLYYSPILEQRNPEIHQLFEQIKLTLRQYKVYSHGKFDYKIYNPKFLDKEEDRAIADGLQPIPLIDINQNALFGISFSDTLTNKAVIPFFSLDRIQFLEQDLTTSIYKMHHKKKKIGLLSKLPIAGNVQQDSIVIQKWEILKAIEDLYDVTVIKTKDELDAHYDAFMLVHPFGLDEDVIEKIKKQKKVLVLLDVADEASRLYSPGANGFISSDLGTLADYWGIAFYNYAVVADFDNSITVDDTINYKKNPSFTQDLLQFRITNNDFNPNHRITYKLNNILFSSASTILPMSDKSVSFYPLIKAGRNSGLLKDDFVKKNYRPQDVLAAYTPENSALILAAEFLSNSAKNPFDVVVVADTDFMYDAFWTKEINYLDTSYKIPLFDSANFILNSLDYLTNNNDLISLRGKTIKRRPLTRIDNMRKFNLYRYKLKETEIFQTIDGAKQGLTEIVAKKTFEEREVFTADEMAIIGNIRKEINDLRQKLSDLKLNAYNDIQKIEFFVKFFNIYFIALLLVLASLIWYLKDKKISKFNVSQKIIFDRGVLTLIFWIIIIFSIAVLTVYFDNKNHISEYEDTLVLKDFSKKINDIKTIKLQNARETLTFKQNNGEWFIEEYPDIPVYQERIRYLLVTLNNMTISEKKSDKIEDMALFGFSPFDNKKSPMINISFYDAQNNELENIDIGWYDIDIGRGSKAAYVRLKNQFQVWLANVDFYDLSLNKENWSYNNLWNLRFGRFISYNDVITDKDVMNIVKNLLNTYYLGVYSEIDAKEIGNIKIIAENNNHINLLFYKSADDRYFVKYDFLSVPQGKHLEFFARYVNKKYLEIPSTSWNKFKDDAIRK